jgi:4-amino-4-deoxy-L-arabinose transferase-like glycosyltransferase
MGTTFFSLHLLPAISGALVVWLVALMVRKMGGNLSALVLALTCVTLAPVYLCFESMYTYDAFDKLCWTLMLYVVAMLLKTADKKYWIYFGVVAGVGLMTKITIVFLVFGILSGGLTDDQGQKVYAEPTAIDRRRHSLLDFLSLHSVAASPRPACGGVLSELCCRQDLAGDAC